MSVAFCLRGQSTSIFFSLLLTRWAASQFGRGAPHWLSCLAKRCAEFFGGTCFGILPACGIFLWSLSKTLHHIVVCSVRCSWKCVSLFSCWSFSSSRCSSEPQMLPLPCWSLSWFQPLCFHLLSLWLPGMWTLLRLLCLVLRVWLGVLFDSCFALFFLYMQCIAWPVAFYTCRVLLYLSLFIHALYCKTCGFFKMPCIAWPVDLIHAVHCLTGFFLYMQCIAWPVTFYTCMQYNALPVAFYTCRVLLDLSFLYMQCIVWPVSFYTCSVLLDLSLFIHAVYCLTCRFLYMQCIAWPVTFYTCSVLFDLSLFINAVYCLTCHFLYMQLLLQYKGCFPWYVFWYVNCTFRIRVGNASYSIRYDRSHGASFIRTYKYVRTNIASGSDNFTHLHWFYVRLLP